MIDRQRFIVLVRRFTNGRLGAESFCAKFTDLWIQNRNEVLRTSAAWPEPYDKLLIQRRIRGELSEQDFAQQFAELWGYRDVLPWQQMIDSVHSACSLYSAAPEQQWEIDGPALRREVANELASYLALATPETRDVDPDALG
jgi:hypothetical protein